VSPNPFAEKLNEIIRQNNVSKKFLDKISESNPNIKYFKFAKYGYDAGSGASTPILVGIPFATVVGLLFYRKIINKPFRYDTALILLVVFAYLVFMTNVSVRGSQRHAATYYPLLAMALAAWAGRRIKILPKYFISFLFIIFSAVTILTLLISPVRPLLPTSVCNYLDQRGGAFGLHKDASLQGNILKKYDNQRIYCVFEWGAVTHRMWRPYFKGEMIEINSSAYDPKAMNGNGLIYVSEVGLKNRYGLLLDDFLSTIGNCQELTRDRTTDARRSSEIGILYWVEDLSKIPSATNTRLYPNQ
jgi:hypothetical protein